MYYLGVDGGGTTTAFLLIDDKGTIVSHKMKATCPLCAGRNGRSPEHPERRNYGSLERGGYCSLRRRLCLPRLARIRRAIVYLKETATSTTKTEVGSFTISSTGGTTRRESPTIVPSINNSGFIQFEVICSTK